MAYKIARNVNIGDPMFAARKMAMVAGSPVVNRNEIACKATLVVDDDGRPVNRRARRLLKSIARKK